MGGGKNPTKTRSRVIKNPVDTESRILFTSKEKCKTITQSVTQGTCSKGNDLLVAVQVKDPVTTIRWPCPQATPGPRSSPRAAISDECPSNRMNSSSAFSLSRPSPRHNHCCYLLQSLNVNVKLGIQPAGVNSGPGVFEVQHLLPFPLGVYLNEKAFLLLEVELLTCYIRSLVDTRQLMTILFRFKSSVKPM